MFLLPAIYKYNDNKYFLFACIFTEIVLHTMLREQRFHGVCVLASNGSSEV